MVEFPKYFVSYCVTGEDSGSNAMRHAMLVMSTWSSQQEPVQVSHAFSFYSQPTGGEPSSLGWSFETAFGINFELSGSFGRLQQEEVRYIDRGGLSGVTYEISAEQVKQLNAHYASRVAEEQAAIDEVYDEERQAREGELRKQWPEGRELDEALSQLAQDFSDKKARPKLSGKTILERERDKAARDNRESRLKEFHVDVRLTPFLDTRETVDCKTEMLALLEKIGISREALGALQPNRAVHGLPRFNGGGLRPILLTSKGPWKKHLSERTKRYARSRQWHQEGKEDGNSLYWLIPPQALSSNDQALRTTLQIPKRIATRAEEVIARLQRLEYRLIKASESCLQEDQKDALANHFSCVYQRMAKASHGYRDAPQTLAHVIFLGEQLSSQCKRLEQSLNPAYQERMRMVHTLCYFGFAGAAILLLIALNLSTAGVGLALTAVAVGGLTSYGFFQTMPTSDQRTEYQDSMALLAL